MKTNNGKLTAISVTGNDLEAGIEECFGKSHYFFITDFSRENYKFIKNPAIDLPKMSGKKAAMYLAKIGVKTVLSGNYGVEVKKILDKNKIQIVIIKSKFKFIKEIPIVSELISKK